MHAAEPDELIKEALCRLTINILINAYASENLLFGRGKANEPIPVNGYIEDLGLQPVARYIDKKLLDGSAIENGCIKDRPFDDYCLDFFADKITYLFNGAPVAKHFSNDDYFCITKTGYTNM